MNRSFQNDPKLKRGLEHVVCNNRVKKEACSRNVVKLPDCTGRYISQSQKVLISAKDLARICIGERVITQLYLIGRYSDIWILNGAGIPHKLFDQMRGSGEAVVIGSVVSGV